MSVRFIIGLGALLVFFLYFILGSPPTGKASLQFTRSVELTNYSQVFEENRQTRIVFPIKLKILAIRMAPSSSQARRKGEIKSCIHIQSNLAVKVLSRGRTLLHQKTTFVRPRPAKTMVHTSNGPWESIIPALIHVPTFGTLRWAIGKASTTIDQINLVSHFPGKQRGKNAD